jgi:hypothetical protein
MTMVDCDRIDALLDAFADGEADADHSRLVREHLDGCAACRRELKLRTRLKLRFIDAGLPGAPAGLKERISRALDTVDRPAPARRWWWASAAAAVLVVAAVLVFPGSAPALPSIVSATSNLHDSVVAGKVTPQTCDSPAALRSWFRDQLQLDVAVPEVGGGCCVSGGCHCTIPESSKLAPFIVYRKGGLMLSLLVVESDDPLPEAARRTYEGRSYHVFRSGANTVVVCRSGRLCHLWTARLDERALLDLVLETREGRQAFSGRRLTLRGIS